jgi:transposase
VPPVRATSLLRRLLGFPRLKVLSVREEDAIIVIEVKPRGRARCSRCGKKRPRYDRLPKRTWRHLDFGPWRVFLKAALSRVDCTTCGVTVEQVSFAEPRSGFTALFEEQVGWLLQRCDKTMIVNFLGIAWRTVGVIAERVVKRLRPPIDFTSLFAISVDELSWRKGQRYITIVTDLERGRVLWTREGRSAETLAAFFQEIGAENCARIRYAAIDMSAAYAKAIGDFLPNAEIVYDRFHVMRLLSDAVDQVRRDEWRRLEGEERDAIKHTRYALLHRPWNVTPEQEETLAILPRRNARLFRAYLLKEAFAGIYDRLLHPGWALRRMNEWMSWSRRSRLEPFRKVARTIQDHLAGILAFFKTGFTTGRSEGINTKARLATRQAYGFHSADAVRAMIELRCSGLLIPLPRTH